jgi:hypothetical protein
MSRNDKPLPPKCHKCNDARFFYPEGKPDLAGPCDKCNSDGEARPDLARKIPHGSDPFPMGKHKEAGHTYNDVPDDYFLWVIDQVWIDSWPQVKNYIWRNFKDELS